MKENNIHTNDITTNITNEIIKRSSLLHIAKIALKRHFFKWPLFSSAFLTLLIFLISKHNVNNFINLLSKILIEIFSISVSAISIIIAAIAIILVIYNKKELNAVITNNTVAFEGFISPYVWGSIIWCCLAIFSLIAYTLNLKAFIYFLFLLFILCYCIFFMLYIIKEIIQHVMLSTMC